MLSVIYTLHVHDSYMFDKFILFTFDLKWMSFIFYRWLLLEMKREFSFEDTFKILEVLWSSLPPNYPENADLGMPLYERKFDSSGILKLMMLHFISLE